MSETLRNNWISNGTSSTESRMDDCAPLVISKEWSHIDDHTKPSVWECTARVGIWELKNNCCCLPCKQDPSSDHTGKDPSEDRNGNCRWTGRIPTRQGDKRSNHESHIKTETALGWQHRCRRRQTWCGTCCGTQEDISIWLIKLSTSYKTLYWIICGCFLCILHDIVDNIKLLLAWVFLFLLKMLYACHVNFLWD